MEWVETTAKSIEEAKDLALDQLGIAADEAEFDVVEEPTSGMFGRVRGEARVRARVMPAAVRPKQERRSRGKNGKRDDKKSGGRHPGEDTSSDGTQPNTNESVPQDRTEDDKVSKPSKARHEGPRQSKNKENQRMDHEREQSDVTPQEVGEAASSFMSQLADAFGYDDANAELSVDGTDLEVRLTGPELGLMVGPGGRTLTAIQDLVRVASQRRLGDHETRLRIDVGGYREKRRAALEKFAATVAAQVIESGGSKALEPMPSSDRKAVHDAIIEIDGVTSRSEGEDPTRRVVITPE